MLKHHFALLFQVKVTSKQLRSSHPGILSGASRTMSKLVNVGLIPSHVTYMSTIEIILILKMYIVQLIGFVFFSFSMFAFPFLAVYMR